jgi:glycosyltransferase involved in cell wall biosynthesis
MKVAIVAGAIHKAKAGVYGSESAVVGLARGFEKAGHDVTFLAAAGSDPVGKFRPVPCMYGQMQPKQETLQYEWYAGELRSMDFIIDWSDTHRVAENVFFWERAKFSGVLVWSHQGNVISSPRPPACFAFHGTVVSEAQRRNCLEHWHLGAASMDPRRLHVIPYGMDTETYRLPEGGSRREYFLYLSRPHPHKGIRAFLELARMFPGEKFVMAFDMAAPDHVQYGTAAIAEAKALPNVEYIPLKGSVAKKVELYQHAKALVIPLAKDYLEGWGLVFAESMACGTPCITAKHGGQVDVVGSLGALCATREEYCDAIRETIKLLPLIGNGEVLRERIVRKFGIDRWVKAYLKLYVKCRREQDAGDWPMFPEAVFDPKPKEDSVVAAFLENARRTASYP